MKYFLISLLLILIPIPVNAVENQIKFKYNLIVKENCIRPEIVKILHVTLETSPETIDGFVWVTSAWRPGNISKHSKCEAFDIRVKNVVGFDLDTFSYNSTVAKWAEKIKKRLGSAYTVIYGVPKHFNHIHIQHN